MKQDPKLSILQKNLDNVTLPRNDPANNKFFKIFLAAWPHSIAVYTYWLIFPVSSPFHPLPNGLTSSRTFRNDWIWSWRRAAFSTSWAATDSSRSRTTFSCWRFCRVSIRSFNWTSLIALCAKRFGDYPPRDQSFASNWIKWNCFCFCVCKLNF